MSLQLHLQLYLLGASTSSFLTLSRIPNAHEVLRSMSPSQPTCQWLRRAHFYHKFTYFRSLLPAHPYIRLHSSQRSISLSSSQSFCRRNTRTRQLAPDLATASSLNYRCGEINASNVLAKTSPSDRTPARTGSSPNSSRRSGGIAGMTLQEAMSSPQQSHSVSALANAFKPAKYGDDEAASAKPNRGRKSKHVLHVKTLAKVPPGTSQSDINSSRYVSSAA